MKSTTVAILVLIVIKVMMIGGLIYIQSTERSQLRDRFKERVEIAATLINQLFDSSTSPEVKQQYATAFGGQVINRAMLDRNYRPPSTSYVAVVNRDSHILASEGHVPKINFKPLIKEAQKHGIVAGSVYNKAAPVITEFPSSVDKQRFLITGNNIKFLQSFFNPLLIKIKQDSHNTSVSIIDNRGFIISSVDTRTKQGHYIPYNISREIIHKASGISPTNKKYFVSTRVSGWNLFIAESSDSLYAPVEGLAFFVPWIILIISISISISLVVMSIRVQTQQEVLKNYKSNLENAVTELDRSNQDLSSFASVAAHDLRAPLRKIMNFIGLLTTEYGDHLPSEAQMYLERISKNSHDLDGLTADLVSYARVTEGFSKTHKVNVSDLVNETIDLIDRDKLTLTLRSLPVIDADAGTIKHVIKNVLENAIKFREGDTAIVDISGSSTNGCDTIEIRDHGIGIPEEYRDRVFEPFQRLHSKSEYEGTGLGLALSKRIIDRHGGSIKAISPRDGGKGIVIQIKLPRGNNGRTS